MNMHEDALAFPPSGSDPLSDLLVDELANSKVGLFLYETRSSAYWVTQVTLPYAPKQLLRHEKRKEMETGKGRKVIPPGSWPACRNRTGYQSVQTLHNGEGLCYYFRHIVQKRYAWVCWLAVLPSPI